MFACFLIEANWAHYTVYRSKSWWSHDSHDVKIKIATAQCIRLRLPSRGPCSSTILVFVLWKGRKLTKVSGCRLGSRHHLKSRRYGFESCMQCTYKWWKIATTFLSIWKENGKIKLKIILKYVPRIMQSLSRK